MITSIEDLKKNLNCSPQFQNNRLEITCDLSNLNDRDILEDLEKKLGNLSKGVTFNYKDDPIEFIKEVFNKKKINNDSLNDILKKKLNKQIGDYIDKCKKNNIKELDKLLGCLKEAYDELINEIQKSNLNKNDKEELLKNIKSVVHLLDTCYGNEKAGGLKEAINSLSISGKHKSTSDKCKFLLLATAITYLKAKGELPDRLEWLYELIRHKLSYEDKNRNISFKFPYCPLLGDVAALLYAYLLCISTQSSQGNP